MTHTVLLACIGALSFTSCAATPTPTAASVDSMRFAVSMSEADAPCSPEPATRVTPSPSGPTLDRPLAPESIAHADDPEPESESPWEKYSLSFGGMLSATSSDVRFGVKGVGLTVDFEDLLGLDTSTSSYRINGSWRFSDNRRHKVDLTWMDLGRSGSLTTQRDIDVGGGTVIPAGTGVKSGFQMNLIRTDYSYSFLQDDRIDLAAVFGLYIAPMKASLETTTGSGYQDEFDVTAPLPLAGLSLDIALTKKWFLRSGFSLFYLEVQGYTGSMTDNTLAVEYKGWEHFAIGAGVDAFSIGVEANGSTDVPGIDKQGSLDYGYTGLMLYLKGLW
ncbi:MAG: hypothetical protein H6831_08390 [Planctomycetes bacterium]|nr:hypothetical protein [Planctomycetota bacterium]MCB9904411.1 hypothetical protein [Planctomycetota bacterium]